MAGTVLIANKFDIFEIAKPEFGENNFIYKFMYFNFIVTVHRFKYYGGWCLAQAGLIATGMTYNGLNEKTGAPEYNRIESCYPLKVELTHEIKTKVDNWNMSV
mmetsp:Transcript_17230/g.2379  ORF Transcript_17230/g.2379 Transcript_17230/m.2379 type:complete len:103 (-) Transcript_17230:440-748(-)